MDADEQIVTQQIGLPQTSTAGGAQANAGTDTREWLVPDGTREIAAGDWPAFCEWFTANFRGISTSLERHEVGNGQMVDCLDRPLLGLRMRVLENAVPALSVAVAGKPRNTVLDLTGPRQVTIHANSAGWPTRLAVSYEDGELIGHFTGELDPSTAATGNSWGE
jgi:hypothetical protein